MHVIKKIEVCDNVYQCSSIAKVFQGSILDAREMMVTVAKQYIKDMYGQITLNDTRVIDIGNLSEIQEPVLPGVYIFKPSENPSTIHLFLKKETITILEGWFTTSKVPVSSFQRDIIYELEEVVGLQTKEKSVQVEPMEMVKIPGGTKVPKAMTVFPHAQITKELAANERFLAISRICENHVYSS